MRIVVLSDYFEDYQENRASSEIRRRTAIELAKQGNEVIYCNHVLEHVLDDKKAIH